MSSSRTSGRSPSTTRSGLNARRRGSVDDTQDAMITTASSPPTRPLRSTNRRDRSSSHSSGSDQKSLTDSRPPVPAQVLLNHQRTAGKKRSANFVRFSPQHSSSDPASVASDVTSGTFDPGHAPRLENKVAVPIPINKGPILNVVVFGETGAGKSSIINLIAGSELAAVSSTSAGCTVCSQSYLVSLGEGHQFRIWDTAGLGEGDNKQSIRKLVELVGALTDGISLIIYCIRGTIPFRDALKTNFDLSWATICEKRVPIVAVVTGLEHRRPMESWWKENLENLENNGMSFVGHACITATKGKPMKEREGNIYDREFEASQAITRKIVLDHCLKAPARWIKDKDVWTLDMLGKLIDPPSPPEVFKLKTIASEEPEEIELDRSLAHFLCIFLFICVIAGVALTVSQYTRSS